jgi:hypothetical protein
MKLSGVSLIAALLLISTASVFGQTTAVAEPADAEKSRQEIEKKALSLLEQAIGDADSLKLSENRVYVFASAADLLWTRDERRARVLFRRAANEIIQSNKENEVGEDELPENFWIQLNIRNQFLNQVANRDAELALEFLRQTRFPILDRALNLPAEKIPLYRNLYQQAQSELNLEKEFAARMTKQNPRRALELARANLSKGVTHADLTLINQLKDAEPEAASQFADEVLQKLLAVDLFDVNDHNTRNLAWSFLTQFAAGREPATDGVSTKAKQFQINKNALRQLAVKYADHFSSSAFQSSNHHQIQSVLPIFERILPDRVAALRVRYEKLKQNYSAQNSHNQYQEKLNQLAGKAQPETLVAEAENFPYEMRGQIYSSAASKMAQAGNYTGARQLLSSLPGKQSRNNALLQLDWQALQKFLNEEKYAEAEQIIVQQTENSHKIRFLIQAANHFSGKKQSEKSAQYISQARALVVTNPEDSAELFDLMQVLTAGAETEPDKTFDLLESFIPKFNEIFAATAFLSKYQPGSSNFRDGELVFPNGNNGLYISGRRGGGFAIGLEVMRLNRLAKANLERAARLADRFERADVRLAARLIILRGVLSDGGEFVGQRFITID